MQPTSLENKVNDFLAQKRIAVAGVSRDKSHHPVGNLIYHRLKTTGHDVWIVDVRGMAVAVHHSAATSVGMVLPNTSTAKGALIFTLQGGVVSVTDSQLTGTLTPWLQLSDGKPVCFFA